MWSFTASATSPPMVALDPADRVTEIRSQGDLSSLTGSWWIRSQPSYLQRLLRGDGRSARKNLLPSGLLPAVRSSRRSRTSCSVMRVPGRHDAARTRRAAAPRTRTCSQTTVGRRARSRPGPALGPPGGAPSAALRGGAGTRPSRATSPLSKTTTALAIPKSDIVWSAYRRSTAESSCDTCAWWRWL